jgi:glycosyltransferase involved in cell wall biosynthesis
MSVAVVVRTKDRPAFLRRALADIGAQSYRPLQIALVNDGGAVLDAEALRDESELSDDISLTVVNNPASLGRWRAANQGLEASDSEFVVLHDDDDTWQPEFLRRTVAFLRAPGNEGYGGVAVRSHLVFESFEEGRIEVRRTEPFAANIDHISIHELMKHNLFPPIAFLYRRRLHELAGMYDASLPVLGDWQFNLRAIRHADFAILDEHLANWHFREAADDVAVSNVTSGSRRQYQENITRLLNSLLRDDMERGGLGIGYAINALYYGREEHEADRLLADDRTDKLANHVSAATQPARDAAPAVLSTLHEIRADLGKLGMRLNVVDSRLDESLGRTGGWRRLVRAAAVAVRRRSEP